MLDHVDGIVQRALSQKMVDGITANAAAWSVWLQAMRDLPATVVVKSLDPLEVAVAARAVRSTSDAWPAPWPQPPAAPVVHLT